ncbi:hypothetical protein LOC68_15335 [Blastopirellula sp. JC732]|uniref:Uncharacterized protein n=1 Tax=Blastopirellula sediminis TaxID=2894196 RepID=A0A9X1MNZ5_9BACT|nr:hypothetical protein [Blastopirellula sediminis]MCC9606943.1 hypothetical protein [Blastopirellula sediminis]MCC9629762.1 hypothetical protein [Blastopirellula sediminis]
MSKFHRRAATEQELKILAKQAETGKVSYGCMTVLFLIVPAAILYFLGDWFGAIISPEAARIGRWTLPTLALVLYLVILREVIQSANKLRAQIQRDLDHQEVEEIRVTNADVGLIGSARPNSNHALVFGMPDRRLLYVKLLPELFEPTTYGAKDDAAVAKGDVLNRLAAPYSFPSTEFVLRRFPYSGALLGIDVEGDYAPPRNLRPSLRNVQLFRPSEIFTGAIDNITEVIEIEQAQRKRGDSL